MWFAYQSQPWQSQTFPLSAFFVSSESSKWSARTALATLPRSLSFSPLHTRSQTHNLQLVRSLKALSILQDALVYELNHTYSLSYSLNALRCGCSDPSRRFAFCWTRFGPQSCPYLTPFWLSRFFPSHSSICLSSAYKHL